MNSALDPSNRDGTFLRILLAAEAMNFETSIVRHHVLETEMREPAKLQQFAQRKISPEFSFGRFSRSRARSRISMVSPPLFTHASP